MDRRIKKAVLARSVWIHGISVKEWHGAVVRGY